MLGFDNVGRDVYAPVKVASFGGGVVCWDRVSECSHVYTATAKGEMGRVLTYD